jgi:DNA-binding transcriptional LysR family regulator
MVSIDKTVVVCATMTRAHSSAVQPDLAVLQTFIEVVNRGSFTAAAAQLRISKSIASRRITVLEEQMEVRLLTRSTRRLVPTEAGLAFHARCRVLLKELEDAWLESRADGGAIAGRLRLTAPTSLESLLVTPVVAALLRRHPALEFDILLTDRRIDLTEHNVDLAIRGGPLGDSTHVARRLALVPAIIVGSPAYLERAGEPTTPAELTAQTFIEHSEIGLQRLWRHQDDRAVAPARVRQRLRINSFDVLTDLALAGVGLCAVPQVQVAAAVEHGRLRPVLQDHPLVELPLWAVFPSARHPSRRLRLLIDTLAAYAARPFLAWGTPCEDPA